MATTSTDKDANIGVGRLLISGLFRIRRLTEAFELADFLAAACPNPRLAVMGITEIFVNAIEHGNLGITFEEKSKLQQEQNWMEEIERRLNMPEHLKKYVEVEFKRTDTEIQLKVTDQGKGFDWDQYDKLDNNKKTLRHGRGILLAKNLCFKSLQYSKNGSEVLGHISLN